MYKLKNVDVDDFMQNYWQQKPVVLRQALPDYNSNLSPEELAGLACEDELESRLVTATNGEWALKHGPFDESDFQTLPPDHWTLLVQAVDHWVPEVADLLNYFRFIPNWRIDDVMVSYANKGGNVGPHTDAYDVFLVQGIGQRRWQVGEKNIQQSQLQDNTELRLLANFNAQHEWTLNQGDILYLPPGYGHWGVSVSERCMTYSVGFRAPSHSEMLSSFCDYQLDNLRDDLRLTDGRQTTAINPGKITDSTFDEISDILHNAINQPEQIKQWFGRYITEAKYPSAENEIVDELSFAVIKEKIMTHGELLRSPCARFAFTENNGNGLLFVGGKQYSFSNKSFPFIELISSNDRFQAKAFIELITSDEIRQLLITLYSYGYLYCEDELFS